LISEGWGYKRNSPTQRKPDSTNRKKNEGGKGDTGPGPTVTGADAPRSVQTRKNSAERERDRKENRGHTPPPRSKKKPCRAMERKKTLSLRRNQKVPNAKAPTTRPNPPRKKKNPQDSEREWGVKKTRAGCRHEKTTPFTIPKKNVRKKRQTAKSARRTWKA